MVSNQKKTKQSWQQVIINVNEDASPLVQQILLDMGAMGLEVDDDETRAIPEKPFSPTHMARIIATFAHDEKLPGKVDRKLASFLGKHDAKWQEVLDGDWVNAFQNSWKSFTLGHDIWVVPSWEAAQFKAPNQNTIVLYLDPGMAFGTGHHETTTLCARAIYECLGQHVANLHKMRVLDVGTGTGISAMIAAKMKVGRVVGTDNDLEAVRVAIENCAHNQLSDKIEILNRPPHFLGPIFDLVVANILANPLIEMSTEIIKAMADNGTLLLSGILQTQEPLVREAYVKKGLVHQKTVSFNEWVLLQFHKKSA